mgnify:CR=1 FL=1
MNTYSVRIGKSRNNKPITSYDSLLRLEYEYRKDDGKFVLCGKESWPEVKCLDCKKTDVVWAEACFVPGHRICPYCGSHLFLNSPVEEDGEWVLNRARFY